MSQNEFSTDVVLLADAALLYGSTGEYTTYYSSGDSKWYMELPDGTLGVSASSSGDFYFKAITAGSSDSPETLTNSDGTIKAGALESYYGPTSDKWYYDCDFLGDALPDEFHTDDDGGGTSTVSMYHVAGAYTKGGMVRVTSDNDNGDYSTLRLGTSDGAAGACPIPYDDDSVIEFRCFCEDQSGYQYRIGAVNAKVFATSIAYFKGSSENSSQWVCFSRDASTSETTNSTYSISSFAVLKIELSTSNVKFYIDDSLVATHTQIPDDEMYWYARTNCNSTDASGTSYIHLDYVKLYGDR